MLYRYNKIILLNSTVAYTLCRNLDHLGKLVLIKELLVYKTIQQFFLLEDPSYKNVSITQTSVTTMMLHLLRYVKFVPQFNLLLLCYHYYEYEGGYYVAMVPKKRGGVS